MAENERAIKAGEAIVERSMRDAKMRKQLRKLQKRLAVFGAGLELLSPVREATTAAVSQELKKVQAENDRRLHSALTDAQEDGQREIESLDRAWESEFGEPPPKTAEDLTRWAVRTGFDVEFVRRGELTAAELYPYIEGIIQKLKDREASGQADKKTDNMEKDEIKLPPHDVNDAARYIRAQRKKIKAGERLQAGKKALIAEHVGTGDEQKINRLDKELQPSRYGWLLEIADK